MRPHSDAPPRALSLDRTRFTLTCRRKVCLAGRSPVRERAWSLLFVSVLVALTGCVDRSIPTGLAPSAPGRLLVATPGAYVQVGAGARHTCAVTTGGGVVCWGLNSAGQATVPAAAQSGMAQVSAGITHTCARTAAGGVVCWGVGFAGQATVPAVAQSGITQVSAGATHTCALTAAGGAVCWGDNSWGQTTVPPAAQAGVAQVSAGQRHTCVVTIAGGVVCWGDDFYGESTVPFAAASGISQVSAGDLLTCALTDAGGVLCWGRNDRGQATVPPTAQSGVAQVSAGERHACAVTASGAVVCWGDPSFGATTVPPGAQSGVTEVTTGQLHTCALTTAGAVLCWGQDGQGQSTVPTAPPIVTHVLPIATFAATGTVVVGQPLILTLTNAQVPGYPQATAFTFAFDCGTGTYSTPSSTATASCPTSTAGPLVVRGTVIDQDGDAASYSAAVTVLTPAQATTQLSEAVAAFGSTQGTALQRMLDAAVGSMARGQTSAACGQLGAFAALVQAQSGKAIPAGAADAWLAQVAAVRGSLGC